MRAIVAALAMLPLIAAAQTLCKWVDRGFRQRQAQREAAQACK